ncbi:uncharacterized protein PHACADRAFT_256061 [Phanerochaete carnosa HHB-10118-sp]|uniref:Uncharacterized protein n=1 Tax=Phanerochaete carnosa (strain HHB-10118-sp) TaxID=650164 RepID=K5W8D7_PHACS|nr:uncharacterized protein PHACADRAFT_256061 [Phanerochaete carnosa HHB-10118-sp]EKM55440.1 hypothetical protein PHACADRAFT_256061 [Phanerochaete carnosa HHB-10118-sp]
MVSTVPSCRFFSPAPSPCTHLRPTSPATTLSLAPVKGRPQYAGPPLFKSVAPPPSPVLETAVRRFMARDARKIFEAHWEEAKKRFGAWNAGLTLRSFIEKNLKVGNTCQPARMVYLTHSS